MQKPISRTAFTLVELLVVLLIIGLLMALIMPALQMARETSRRTQCRSHLMRLIVGIQNYEDAHSILPPGVVDVAGPTRNQAAGYHVGWLVQLLPFIDREAIYHDFDFRHGVYAAENSTVTATRITTLLCPTESSDRMFDSVPGTNYAAAHDHREVPIDIDNTGVFFLNSSVRSGDIADGSEHTIYAGEKTITTHEFGWSSGTRASLRNAGTGINAPLLSLNKEITPTYVGGFGSGHVGGAHFILGDGSVRFISQTADATVFERLVNRMDSAPAERDAF